MFAGLSLAAWILIVTSVGLGLAIELLYLRARVLERSAGRHAAPGRGPSDPAGSGHGPDVRP